MKQIFIITVMTLLISITHSYAEIVKLSDGRLVDLKPDGTYEFIESKERILLSPQSCENEYWMEVDKDEWGDVQGYLYYVGFKFTWKILNETSYPLVFNQLETTYSKDYGFNTKIKSFNHADAIQPGKSLFHQPISPHMLFILSEKELEQDKIDALKIENGCTKENFTNQTLYINLANVIMEFHKSAGNLNPLDFIEINQSKEYPLLFGIN